MVSKAPVLLPLVHHTLHAEVYRSLREALMSGRFHPGQPISIRAVAEMLGVSTMPVRQALHRLEAERALEVGAGRGLCVPMLSAGSIAEIRDVRCLLEGRATELAAARITPVEIEGLRECCRKMSVARQEKNIAAYIQENFAFHAGIYRASGNRSLMEVIEGLWLRVGPYVSFLDVEGADIGTSMRNHADVLGALQKGNGLDAGRAICQDIIDGATALERILAEAQGIAVAVKRKKGRVA